MNAIKIVIEEDERKSNCMKREEHSIGDEKTSRVHENDSLEFLNQS